MFPGPQRRQRSRAHIPLVAFYAELRKHTSGIRAAPGVVEGRNAVYVACCAPCTAGVGV